MSVLRSVLALSMANSPPAEVPDARGAVAIWCAPTCPAEQVETLRTELAEDFVIRRWYPWREATSARATVEVIDAAAWTYGLPNAEGRDLSRLPAEALPTLEASQELVLVRWALPKREGPLLRARQVARAAKRFSAATGALVEDVDTLQVFDLDGWTEARAQALKPEEPQTWELFSLDWSPDGTRVVTRGLRKLGLHDLVVEGVDSSFADDVAVTLVLVAQTELENGTPHRYTLLGVESLQNAAVKEWLRGWRVYADDPGAAAVGTGSVNLELRNVPPWPGDPSGPLLQIGPSGKLDDPQAWASLLDEVWGWADEVPQAAEPAPELAVPVQGWGAGD
ncbi:MAG: hypothetical protein H6740_20815 [Alphaproteobacteria bacterium]|nr:hypothetical protein [Alphaproteobacteria bacterium]